MTVDDALARIRKRGHVKKWVEILRPPATWARTYRQLANHYKLDSMADAIVLANRLFAIVDKRKVADPG